jgi:hypothetical protein
MAIVGDHPETGVRFVLERPRRADEAAGGAWIYRGDAFTPDARFSLEVRVARDGNVGVTGAAALPPEIAEKVRLLFRSLYKQADVESGGEPPRKVVRWRGEK